MNSSARKSSMPLRTAPELKRLHLEAAAVHQAEASAEAQRQREANEAHRQAARMALEQQVTSNGVAVREFLVKVIDALCVELAADRRPTELHGEFGHAVRIAQTGVIEISMCMTGNTSADAVWTHTQDEVLRWCNTLGVVCTRVRSMSSTNVLNLELRPSLDVARAGGVLQAALQQRAALLEREELARERRNAELSSKVLDCMYTMAHRAFREFETDTLESHCELLDECGVEDDDDIEAASYTSYKDFWAQEIGLHVAVAYPFVFPAAAQKDLSDWFTALQWRVSVKVDTHWTYVKVNVILHVDMRDPDPGPSGSAMERHMRRRTGGRD